MMSKKTKEFEEIRLTGFELTALEHHTEEDEQGIKKKFRGVAYTGNVIPRHGMATNLVIDLENVDFQAQIPIFKNHDANQIVGFGSLFSDGDQLIVQGEIVDTEHGREVSKLNDAGFKWELSVGVSAESVVEMGDEEVRIVNGQRLEGYHFIFKNPRITETSFVPIGADRNTSVSVFSRLFGKKKPTFEAEIVNEQNSQGSEEQDMERVKELEAQLAEANAKLAEIELNEAKKDIESKLAGMDVDLSEDIKGKVVEALLSTDELSKELAEHIISVRAVKEEVPAEPTAEELEAKAKEEEEAKLAAELAEKEEAEKAAKLEAEKKKAHAAELFSQDKIEEGNAPKIVGKSLRSIADDLQAKNPTMDRTTAIFEAKKLKTEAGA